MLLGCLGGGKTDKEMEVSVSRQTETKSVWKKVPSPTLTRLLQRSPGLGGRSQRS